MLTWILKLITREGSIINSLDHLVTYMSEWNLTAHAHEQLLGKRDSNSIQSWSRENGIHLISHLAMYLVSARLLAPVTWKRLITQNFDIEIIMIILRFTECNRILSAVKLTTSVFYVAMPRRMTTAFRCNMLFLSSGLTSTSNPPSFDHSNNVLLWKLYSLFSVGNRKLYWFDFYDIFTI